MLSCWLWCLSSDSLSLGLARRRLYGGGGSRGGRPRSGCWWCVHWAPSPTTGCDRGADSGRVSLLWGLQGLSTDVVMLLPVFMLTKRATVSGCVTATARLTCFPATVPATLKEKERCQVNAHEGKKSSKQERCHGSHIFKNNRDKMDNSEDAGPGVTLVSMLPSMDFQLHHNLTLVLPLQPAALLAPQNSSVNQCCVPLQRAIAPGKPP